MTPDYGDVAFGVGAAASNARGGPLAERSPLPDQASLLWFVIGLHLAWSFMLGGVFGPPASGIDAGGGLLQGKVSGPAWLIGSTFGPEGSVIAVIFGLGLGVFLLVTAQQRGNLTTRVKRTH